MRLFIIVSMLIFSGCSDATEAKKNLETCDVFFKEIGPCQYKNIVVNIEVKKIASDEKLLHKLKVKSNGREYSLTISKDTSIIDGDKGYISFVDINFDSVPDIAITTSFGLANLYMDYWVYDTAGQKYFYIGNFSKFKIDNQYKTLSNEVKISAAKYKNTTYIWKGFNLIEKNK